MIHLAKKTSGRLYLNAVVATLLAAAISTCGTLSAAQAQSSNKIESLGVVTGRQLSSGLGFNINPANEWEFQTAASAGATTVRFQCGWEGVETQTAPPHNTNGLTQYALPPDCQAGLAFSRKYGMRPTILAAYGSPFHAIVQVSLPQGARAGANTLVVQFITGIGGDNLSNIKFPYDTIISANGSQITKMHSYAGGLITSIKITDPTHAVLSLASSLVSDLPANGSLSYTINEYLYPPAGSFAPDDPSVLAFAKYAEFLASCIAGEGLTGEVELWNEPPWNDDPWDDRVDFYDQFPGTPTSLPRPYMPNFGFVAALQNLPSPGPNVTFVWGGTHKSGASSLFNWMQRETGVSLSQPNKIVTAEAIHPYGNTPEDSLWSEACLSATVSTYPAGPGPFSPCNIYGVPGGNASLGEQYSLLQKNINPNWGVRREITETGLASFAGDPIHQARFTLRQFLGYQAQGVSPIEFYRLWDGSEQTWGFVSKAATTTEAAVANIALSALAGLMSDVNLIAGDPVAHVTNHDLAVVQSFTGTYPLDSVQVIGTRSGETMNSLLIALWQRSNGPSWGFMSSPPQAAAVVALPQGLSVNKVVNLTTRENLPYKLSGQSVSVQVSDDPVEILMTPLTVTAVAISPSTSTLTVGNSLSLLCTATRSDGTSAACASPTYETSDSAVARLSGDILTASGPGVTTLSVKVGGLVANTAVSVNPAIPNMVFAPMPTQAQSGNPFLVLATSPSFGTISYSVTNGSAAIDGGVVTPYLTGVVTIRASQAPAGNYAASYIETNVKIVAPATSVLFQVPVSVVSSVLQIPGVTIRIPQAGMSFPTGTVSIVDNGSTIWSYHLDVSRRGVLGGVGIPPMQVGKHSLSVYYGGDGHYASGTSSIASVTVVPDQSALNGSCQSFGLVPSKAVKCVIRGLLGANQLDGFVNYSLDGVQGSIPLIGGVATLVVPNTTAGILRASFAYPAQGANPACPYTLNLSFIVN